jgi:predicted N-acetyltransferase YhbS
MPVYLAGEQPHHGSAIEALNDEAFGPARHGKTVALFRQGVAPVQDLCLVGLETDTNKVVGSIRYWPVALGETRQPSVMLGPVVAAPDWRGKKIDSLDGNTLATALILNSVYLAQQQGHDSIVLKSTDASLIGYYEKLGFSRDLMSGLVLSGANSAHESTMLMGLELVPGSLAKASGIIGKHVSPKVFVPSKVQGLAYAV